MRIRVLIVDDDVALARSVRATLSIDTFECGLAHTYHLAVEALEHHTFDVALIDVQLAGRSGVDLVHEVRVRWPEVAAVLMSAMDHARLMRVATAASIRTFLPKPFGPAALHHAIHEATFSSGMRPIVRPIGSPTGRKTSSQ